MPTTSKKPELPCPHKTVRRSVMDGVLLDLWECEVCKDEFWGPNTIESEIKDVMKTAETRADKAILEGKRETANLIDAMAGAFGAVLWEHQAHTFEVYGVQPTMDDPAAEPDKAPAWNCDTDGHYYLKDEGPCTYCGAPKFLGATE